MYGRVDCYIISNRGNPGCLLLSEGGGRRRNLPPQTSLSSRQWYPRICLVTHLKNLPLLLFLTCSSGSFFVEGGREEQKLLRSSSSSSSSPFSPKSSSSPKTLLLLLFPQRWWRFVYGKMTRTEEGGGRRTRRTLFSFHQGKQSSTADSRYVATSTKRWRHWFQALMGPYSTCKKSFFCCWSILFWDDW